MAAVSIFFGLAAGLMMSGGAADIGPEFPDSDIDAGYGGPESDSDLPSESTSNTTQLGGEVSSNMHEVADTGDDNEGAVGEWGGSPMRVTSSDEDFRSDTDSDDEAISGDVRQDANFYRDKWDHPLYDNAGLTVGEAIYAYLKKKVDDCEQDKASDRHYRMLRESILPAGNCFPPSLYLLRKVAGVQNLHDHEYHVCEKEHYRWPKIRRDEWLSHRDDVCPVCQTDGVVTKRFKKLRGGQYEPCKVRFGGCREWG